MAKPKAKRARMSEMQLKYAVAWKGNNAEAARAVGAKCPNDFAYRANKNPQVLAIIADKKHEFAVQSAKKLASKLTKTDVLERLIFWAQTPVEKTNGTITGQVKATMGIAEVQGYLINRNLDLNKFLEGKTTDEMEHYARTGRWPDPTRGGIVN